MNTKPRQPFNTLPLPQQAGILCNDPRFQEFAALRCGFQNVAFTFPATTKYLRDACQIDSRTELATTPEAAEKFNRLRTEFDAWRGKIPNQR